MNFSLSRHINKLKYEDSDSIGKEHTAHKWILTCTLHKITNILTFKLFEALMNHLEYSSVP